MTDRIQDVLARAAALEARLADPALSRAPGEYARVARELGQLRPLVDAAGRFENASAELAGARELLAEGDAEMQELARGEVERLEAARAELDGEIRALLVPRDPTDDKSAILEIRAGTGGEEAALFAAELFRMYQRYAEAKGWKVELLSTSESEKGGFREVIAGVSGEGVFGELKHERGVHRVQRVPETESAGRIHTSTVTVAVLPEAEEVEIEIDPQDLRIDVFRSGGPGGQSVNTTDSAVRITHIPTNTVVQCQDEKSQHKNKARALKILRARLLEVEQRRAAEERASERRAQVGTGARTEKIRTYNFPQSRITDHRAGITVHRLEQVLEGDLGELLEGVRKHMAAEAEKQALAEGAGR
ncbi:MAG TPA: peptide chain release factor 1 [Myxococcota bacterium]|nr:peptide chain release factor 1 [Myxococcota bacterium]